MLTTGIQIREMREASGLSQAQLASMVGVSQAHIAKIENERVDPRLSTVNRILSALSQPKQAKLCKDIMIRHIVKVGPDETVERIVSRMKGFAISQVPVFRNGVPVGNVGEATIIRNMHRNLKNLKARSIMERPFPIVNADDPVDMLPEMLNFHQAVLVSERGRMVGIITKSDLLKV